MTISITFEHGKFFKRQGFLTQPIDLRTAARNRKLADHKAEKVLQKLMLVATPFPSGGVVCSPYETLLPFQKDLGVPFLLSQNHTYLAHQPGLGKSAQSIAASSSKPGKTLIVCPSSLRINWAREITRWYVKDFPDIAIVPQTPRAHKMFWDADFVICSDAMLLREWVRVELLKRSFRHIFVDEAHRFKEFGAARSVALFGGRSSSSRGNVITEWSSPGLVYKAEHVGLLSGTPMLGKPIELWSVLYALAPEVIDFMPRLDFGFKYCAPRKDDRGNWVFDGASNENELHSNLTNKFMQRIRKRDVLKDLPEKIRELILIDVDSRTKDVKAFDRQVIARLKTETATPESLGEYAELRHATGLSKVAWAVNFVKEYLESDETESVILFAYHRDVVHALRKGLEKFKPMVVMGGVAEAERTFIQDQFQARKRRLIIGNISAMSLGITLTAATRVVFAEYSPSPADNEQAEDRGNRIGSLWGIYCQYLVLPGTTDEIFLRILMRKMRNTEKIIEGAA